MATKETAPKTKKIHVEPISEISAKNNPAEIDIPGWVFSWQNINTNDKSGWGIFRPVQKDTELGEEVARQLGVGANPFGGTNADANMYYFGGDLVLAYTSQELYDKMQADDQKAADFAMSAIGDDAAVHVRHAAINPGVKKGPHAES